MQWSAGTAQACALLLPQPPSPAQESSPPKASFFAGVLSVSTTLGSGLIVGTLILQGILSSAQCLFDVVQRDLLSSARLEQQWLVDQGLSSHKPISQKKPLLWTAHKVFDFVRGTPADEQYDTISSAELTSAPMVFGLQLVPLASFLGEKTPLISISGSLQSYSPEMLSYVIRHEDAHSELEARKVQAFHAQHLTSEENQALDTLIRLGADGWAPADPNTNNLAQWAASYYHEAWADTRSILEAARKEPGSMRAIAFRVHKKRLIGDNPLEGSPLLMSGEPHATDPAIFLAAQLSEQQVASLSRSALDQLCDQITSDSLVWALARLGPKPWITDQRADQLLATAFSLSEHPMSAFEGWKSLTHKLFKKQLPSSFKVHQYALKQQTQTVQSPYSGQHWRFDGLGGLLQYDGHHGIITEKLGTINVFNSELTASESLQVQAHLEGSFQALSTQHQQLAELLKIQKDDLAQGRLPNKNSLTKDLQTVLSQLFPLEPVASAEDTPTTTRPAHKM